MKRFLAAALACAQIVLASCAHNPSNVVSANTRSMLVAAPCPSPGEVNPLAGIEGWAPGAGEASKMGGDAQKQMGGFGGAFGGRSDESTAAPSPSSAKNCQELSPHLSGKLAKLADLRKQLPTTGYDVAARAATFKSPDEAFSFVRDRVRLDAYAGVMRGARGTLMSRAGSPADKAMLLHDLLAAQSIQTRYVHTTLTESDAAKLVAAATLAAPIDPKGIVAGPDAASGLRDGMAVAEHSLTAARALLAKSHLQLVTDGSKVLAQLRENVRDHWWLQAQIDGRWTDFDASLPGTESGSHVGGAPSEDPADTLPAALHHTIAIRLLADTGAATPQPLAHVESTTDDAVEQPIVAQMNGSATLDEIKTQTSFTPVVAIGETKDEESAFTPDGDAKLRALYLEIETRAPGAQPVVHRQVVVDRRSSDGKTIDPAWTPGRTAYAMTFEYRGLEATGDMDPAYNVATNIDATIHGAIAANYAAQHPDTPGLPEDAVSTYPYEAHRFFEYDQSIRGAMQAHNAALAWTFDHPMLALYEQTFDSRADGLRFVQSFDIVDNALLATANSAVASGENAERGLMDTSAEGALISGPGTHLDTASVFAAAKASNHPLGIVTSASAASRAPVAAHDALLSSLNAQTVAIAPSGAVSLDGTPTYGWVEVDLTRGNTVGRTTSGAGQAMSERAILEKFVERYSAIKAYGRCINCVFSGFSEALSGSREHGQKFVSCAVNALCQFAVDYAFDWFYVHGFEMEGTGFSLLTGPYLDLVGEVIGGGPTGAICDNVSTTNPYSRPIIG